MYGKHMETRDMWPHRNGESSTPHDAKSMAMYRFITKDNERVQRHVE